MLTLVFEANGAYLCGFPKIQFFHILAHCDIFFLKEPRAFLFNFWKDNTLIQS